MMAGKALIFSAPSGSGKTTIVRHLIENNPDFRTTIKKSQYRLTRQYFAQTFQS
jgi:guanylate kinase